MFGSYEYCPEAREEEERIVRNDRLRTRRPRKSVVVRQSRKLLFARLLGGRHHIIEEKSEIWVLGAPFVPLDEIVDPATDFHPGQEDC